MQITWTITNNCEYIPDENEWPTTTNDITRTKVPKKHNIFEKKFKNFFPIVPRKFLKKLSKERLLLVFIEIVN